MLNTIIEAGYPIGFRKEEASELGKHLKNRESIVLVGMKRVGISNFLRFFLNHQDFVSTYVGGAGTHLFIPVDLNDLVEREIFPFWILTLKRILDAVESSPLNDSDKKYLEKLLSDSMKTKDMFLIIEGIRKGLVKLVEFGILPTIFFIRFDRISDVITPDFFSNLEGLRDATNSKLSYVFTSYRDLVKMVSKGFSKSSLSLFAKDVFIKPAIKKDIKIIFDAYRGNYKIHLSSDLEDSLFEIVDGYIQYLQLALAALRETDVTFNRKGELFDFLSSDERIGLQSEELWESFEEEEKSVLLKIVAGEQITEEEKQKAEYLWDTGCVEEKDNKRQLFSGLFALYVKKRQEKSQVLMEDFTKKENLLFNFLKDNLSKLCERENIIGTVWPEVEVLGVSDWAIDRLVARVRSKLKLQKSKYEIQTVKTRGYKLVKI